MNRLYYGDCLTIMQQEMTLGSVDLVYLDPPFNSNQDYNAIYKDETGRPLPDQIEAFGDLWRLDEERLRAIRMMPVLMREAGLDDHVAELWKVWMNALRYTQPSLLSYLSYMTERLLAMKGLIKPTGSVYLHCDPTASHYIKCIMDGIFGHENFRNEIIWKRNTSHNSGSQFGRIHDIILYYSKGRKWTWNLTYAAKFSDEQLSRYQADQDGRLYKAENLTAARPNSNSGKFDWRGSKPGSSRGWAYTKEQLEEFWDKGRILLKRDGTPRLDGLKVYLDDLIGPRTQSIWDDIPRIPNVSKERLGYATQKPVALLERIISASSNPGDVVFDPFCGCATTLEAAHRLGRKWIGIDIAIHAVKRVAKVRLEDRLGLVEGRDFTIEGVPHSTEGAQDLWDRDKHQFQKWAIEQIDGFVTTRKTGDGGIDGRLYFSLPNEHDLQSMVLEVKGGRNVNISVVRDLRGALERDGALMAGLIVMHDLGERKTTNFKREMAAAGDLNVSGVLYPKMQLLTVEEVLSGKRFVTPSVARGKVLAQPVLPFG